MIYIMQKGSGSAVNQGTPDKGKMMKIKRFISVAIIVISVLFSGCSATDVEENAKKILDDANDQLENINDATNEYVILVKNGYPISYPDCEYGDVFDSFFGNPTWKYFKSDDGKDIVEFTGYCMYAEQKVKARLQFIVDKKNGVFETGALSFNEVPQANFYVIGLLTKAFTQYMEENGIEIEEENIERQIEDIFINDYAYENNYIDNNFDTGDTGMYADSEFVLPNSSTEYLSDALINSLTQEEIRIAINEIYARHGRLFNSEDLTAYFNSMSWYHGYIAPEDWDDNLLNKIEQKNIKKLAAKRDAGDSPSVRSRGDGADDFIEGSDYRYITYDDIMYMDRESIRFAKNEIYARHGYIFKSKDLYEYFFNATDWYYPTISSENWSDNYFNEYEKANVKFLQEVYDNWGN